MQNKFHIVTAKEYLLECPLCGGEAEIYEKETGRNRLCVLVRCKQCGARSRNVYCKIDRLDRVDKILSGQYGSVSYGLALMEACVCWDSRTELTDRKK